MADEHALSTLLCGSGGTPLNQGKNETCVAYAMGCVTSANLRNKYGVAVHAEKLKNDALSGAETMKGETVWKGNLMMEFAKTWNVSVQCELYKTDINEEKRYKFWIDVEEIMTFDAAFEKMRELQLAGLQMMIALTTDTGVQHAISAWRCDPVTRTITAMNSHGADEPNMTVNSGNFIRAVTVDPIITHRAWKKKTIVYDNDTHPTTDHYKSMPHLFAREKKLEADAGALQAAQGARQAAQGAQQAAEDAQRAAEAQVQNERDRADAAEREVEVARRAAEVAQDARQAAQDAQQAAEVARRAAETQARADAAAVQLDRNRADAAESEVGRQATEIEALKKQVLSPFDPIPAFSAPLRALPP